MPISAGVSGNWDTICSSFRRHRLCTYAAVQEMNTKQYPARTAGVRFATTGNIDRSFRNFSCACILDSIIPRVRLDQPDERAGESARKNPCGEALLPGRRGVPHADVPAT